MEDQLISFNTAKLAKEKGFDMAAGYAFFLDGNNWTESLYAYTKEEKELFIARPTQSLLQKWLREVHQFSIIIYYGCASATKFSWYCGEVQKPNHRIVRVNWDGDAEEFRNALPQQNLTYEEALEEALIKALKLIC